MEKEDATAYKTANPLLAAIQETATDLRKACFMSRKSLREYDVLCLDDEVFEARDIVNVALTASDQSRRTSRLCEHTISYAAQWELGTSSQVCLLGVCWGY